MTVLPPGNPVRIAVTAQEPSIDPALSRVYPKETRYVTSPQVSASRVTRSALITLCHEKMPLI